MTQYPIELPPSSIAGLSPAQTQALYKGPFVDHIHRLPKLGAGVPRTLVNGVGLYLWGVSPMGDFSGTSQVIDDASTAGSGGPFGCPYGATSVNGIVTSGKCKSKTGTPTTTSAPLEVAVSGRDFVFGAASDWTYKIAWRKMTAAVISWDSGGAAGSKIAASVSGDPDITGATFETGTSGDLYPKIRINSTHPGEDFDAYTFTGDDWVFIRAVNTISGLIANTGWFRIRQKISSTCIELTADASMIYPEDTTVDFWIIQSAQAQYSTQCTCIDSVDLTMSSTTLANYDGDTFTVNGRTYTLLLTPTVPAAADEIHLTGNRANVIDAIAAALGDNSDVTVISDTTSTVTFRASTRTKFNVSVSNVAGSELKVNGGTSTVECSWGRLEGSFAATVASTDDTAEIVAITEVTPGVYELDSEAWEHVRSTIVSCNGTAMYVEDPAIASSGDVVDVIHWKRYPFVERDLDVTNSSTTLATWTAVLTGDGWSSDAPKRGDHYIMWVDAPGAGFTTSEINNPESTPTYTATSNTCAGMWPYGQPVRSTPMGSVRPFAYGNLPEAIKESQTNYAYNGFFTMPAETFVTGDKLKITTLSDLTTYGQPIILEALVLFDFDPDADWLKTGDIANYQRLYPAGESRGAAFQSPPIKVSGKHGIRVTIEAQAGSVQTGSGAETADNFSQQWTCMFEMYQDPDDDLDLLGNGGPSNRQTPGTPYTVGPIAHISTSKVVANASRNSRVAVLYKTEHPAMRHQVGYRGYYGGEPFSCTTGNGGTLLHFQGFAEPSQTDSLPDLPYGGQWRCASVSVEWTPGGNY